MTITFRYATKEDARVIGDFQRAQGYHWNIWREEVIARYLPFKHVHVLVAEEAGKMLGFVHWVEGSDVDGPVWHYVGAIVKEIVSPSATRLNVLDALSLRFGKAMGNIGRWKHEASKDDLEGIAYARMVAPTSETVAGNRHIFEGNTAATYAYIEPRVPTELRP